MIRVLCLITICVFGSSCEAQQKSQPNEELALLDASAVQLLDIFEQHKGNKPVLVNFWATWCAPCIEEFPYIVELKKEYGDKFELVFVSGDFEEAKNDARAFLDKQGVDFVTYFKKGKDDEFISSISDSWTGALPFTLILDKQGNISAEWEGKAEIETFREELLKVIGK